MGKWTAEKTDKVWTCCIIFAKYWGNYTTAEEYGQIDPMNPLKTAGATFMDK